MGIQAKDRYSKRIYSGLEPEWYSKITYVYDDDGLTVTVIYSTLDEDKVSDLVTGVVRYVYTDTTQCKYASIERIS